MRVTAGLCWPGHHFIRQRRLGQVCGVRNSVPLVTCSLHPVIFNCSHPHVTAAFRVPYTPYAYVGFLGFLGVVPASLRRDFPDEPLFKPVHVIDELVAEGKLGVKSGEGFHSYK